MISIDWEDRSSYNLKLSKSDAISWFLDEEMFPEGFDMSSLTEEQVIEKIESLLDERGIDANKITDLLSERSDNEHWVDGEVESDLVEINKVTEENKK